MVQRNNDVDALHMLHLVAKIFYKANHLFLAPSLLVGDQIDVWINLFKSLLDMPIPPELLTKTDDADQIMAKNKNIYWKIKSYAGRISYRLFAKYADLDYVESKPEQQAFAQKFRDRFAVPLLESNLKICMSYKDCFVAGKTLNIAIKFVKFATKLDYTMDKLKPFV